MYCPIRRLLQSIEYVRFVPSHSAIVGRMISSPLRNRAEWNITSHFMRYTSAIARYSPYIHAIIINDERSHLLRILKSLSLTCIAFATFRSATPSQYQCCQGRSRSCASCVTASHDHVGMWSAEWGECGVR